MKLNLSDLLTKIPALQAKLDKRESEIFEAFQTLTSLKEVQELERKQLDEYERQLAVLILARVAK